MTKDEKTYMFELEMHIESLIKNNKRLRALIKKAQFAGEFCDDPACPWCLSRSWGKHLDCPAFNPDGSVK